MRAITPHAVILSEAKDLSIDPASLKILSVTASPNVGFLALLGMTDFYFVIFTFTIPAGASST